MLRARDQLRSGLEHRDAGAFRADERARHVESVFGKELIEVVTRHTSRDIGKPRANQRRVAIADRAQARIDLSAASALADDRVQFGVGGGADAQLRAVIQQDPQLVDVVDGLSRQQGMRPAGVVADHAAERAAAVRRGIRSKREMVRLRTVSQRVEHDTGLNAGESLICVQLQDRVHALGEVEHDGDVAALACQARPRSSRQQRRAELPARGHRGDDIVRIAWNDEPDRDLPVIRSVGRVQCAASAIEANFAANRRGELALQL